MSKFTRRSFLKASTAAFGTTVLLGGTRCFGEVEGANNRIRIGIAGLNGRGQNHLDGFMGLEGVEIAYLIDPDRSVLDRTMARLRETLADRPVSCKAVLDVREALDDPEVDAISIAAPNHWHSLMTIWAAQAGKHVYVEKPASHDVVEGRVAVEAQKKYGVVIQHGTQQRSSAAVANLHASIQAGQFGRLRMAYGYACKPREGIGTAPPKQPPEHLDWNLWRGPATIEQYHDNLVHYNWHWFWKTGNGDLNNQGTHELDVARWALDADQTHPLRAMAIGGRFLWNDQGETPNTLFGIAEYPNGQQVFFNVRNVNYEGYERQVRNEYYFEDGGRILGGRYYAKGSDQPEPITPAATARVTPGGNWGSFIAACRAGDPTLANGTITDAHYSCVLGHLISNSYRLGRKVPFNSKAGQFGDDKDAAEHFLKLHEIMHGGVGIPEDSADYIVGPWLAFDPKTERHTGPHAEEANALLKDPNRKGFEVPQPDKV